MPKQKIRFAVGAPDAPRSAVWSLFWREHDAYVVSVEAGGIAKVSFHLDIGEFSWGYTKDYFEQNRSVLPTDVNRDFERWLRPPECEPGLTLPLRIYVANEALTRDLQLPTKKVIRWVRPRIGKAVGFVFVLAARGVPENAYDSIADLELLGRAPFSHRN